MLGGGKDIRPRSGRMGYGIHGTGMAMVGKIRRNSPFIAPRLKRQDRLFSKGLSDPPHGGTIMSKWCGNENCLLCVDNEPDPYVRLLREDYDALRAENQRLKGALETIVKTDRGLEYSNREQHKRYIADDNWWGEKRHSHTFEAWIAQAALQPERGTRQ